MVHGVALRHYVHFQTCVDTLQTAKEDRVNVWSTCRFSGGPARLAPQSPACSALHRSLLRVEASGRSRSIPAVLTAQPRVADVHEALGVHPQGWSLLSSDTQHEPYPSEQQHGTMPAQVLTSAIREAGTVPQLLQLCQHNRAMVNYIHAAAALTRLAKLLESSQRGARAAAPAVQTIARLALQHAPDFQARATVNALWAASKLLKSLCDSPAAAALQPTSRHMQTARSAVQDLAATLVTRLPSFLADLEPQHHASCMYALATVHTALQPAARGTPRADTGQVQQASEPQLPGALTPHQLRSVASQLLQSSLAHMPHMTSQGVSNMLYGAAVLDLQPHDAWMDSALDHSVQVLHTMQPQHVSNTLWALAKLDYFPGDDWIEAVVQQQVKSDPQLRQFTPQGLATALWALAKLQAVPPAPLLQQLLAAVCHHTPQFSAQDVSHTMRALAEFARLAPQQAADATDVVAHSLPGQHTQPQLSNRRRLFSNSEASEQQQPIAQSASSSVAAALSRQALTLQQVAAQVLYYSVRSPPPPPASRPSVSVTATARGSPFSTGNGPVGSRESSPQPGARRPCALLAATPEHLAVVLWACSALDLQPQPSWCQLYWQASYRQLHRLSQQEAAMLLLALGRLRLRPPHAWWLLLLRVTYQQLPNATPRLLAHAIFAMARLRFQPPQPWLNVFLQQLEKHGDSMGAKASACVSKSLSRLGVATPGGRLLPATKATGSPSKPF